MFQQPSLFTEEMFESPELMQAIVESYLEANPSLKSCTQGFAQLIASFANNFCHQCQNFKNPNNDNNNNDTDANNQNSNNNVNDDNDLKNNNQNENHQTDKDETPKNTKKTDHPNPDSKNIFDIISQLFGNNYQQLPFFSSLIPLINQMFQGIQPNQTPHSNSPNKEKNHIEEDNNVNEDSLIQDIIMQTLDPEVFESTTNQSNNGNNNDNDESNKEVNDENINSKQNQVLNFIEMIKVLYQLYLQDKDHPNNFINPLINSLSNVIGQFLPQFQSLFYNKMQRNNKEDFNFEMYDPSNFLSLIFNNPYFRIINPSSNNEFKQESPNQQNCDKNKQLPKRAELRRSKFTDSNGIITLRIRHSIGDKWHEVEKEMNPDGETIRASKETWNNISEDQFNDFKDEWKKLYETQKK